MWPQAGWQSIWNAGCRTSRSRWPAGRRTVTATGPISTVERPLPIRRPSILHRCRTRRCLWWPKRMSSCARLARAATAFRTLARSPDARLRAAALLGLGRVLRKAGDHAGALRAYDALDALGPVMVAGQPASLVAKQARGGVFEETGDRIQLGQEAVRLSDALARETGRSIDRPSSLSEYRAPLGGPGDESSSSSSEVAIRTEAAIRLWQSWRANGLPPRGPSVLLLSLISGAGCLERRTQSAVAWFGTPRDLEALLGPLSASQRLTASAHTVEGQRLFGTARSDDVE